MKNETLLFTDINEVPLLLIKGVSCKCGNSYANIICTFESFAVDPLDDPANLIPIIKFCPCGIITINKDILQSIRMSESNLEEWL